MIIVILIHHSEIENVPDEDVKTNTSNNNKNRVPVTPIHVPEKPNTRQSNFSKKECPDPNIHHPLKNQIPTL